MADAAQEAAAAAADFNWAEMEADGLVDTFDADDVEKAEMEAAAEGGDDDDAMEGVTDRVYIPGAEMDEDEELICDMGAYVTSTEFSSEWPCLSLDILRDEMGDNRSRFPATVYAVSGTQAADANQNSVFVMKMSNLQRAKAPSSDSESDSEDEEDESMPKFSHRSVKHGGTVNRVRVAPAGAGFTKHIVATLNDGGRTRIFDLTQHVKSLDEKSAGGLKNKPTFQFDGGVEGYALAWSPVANFHLATGDNSGRISFVIPNASGWSVDIKGLNEHDGSVEDIQWSPNEASALASCGVDKTIRFWNLKAKKCAIKFQAHNTDVNVISWNPTEQHLIASGGDDGVFKVWDLRMVAQNKDGCVASFDWHRGPITSIDWHPTDASSLCVGGADHQITLWDMSVEADVDHQGMKGVDGQPDIPSQLMFIHQGQKNVKEAHWHPQIPGLVVSTGENGFNVFKSISL